MHYAWAQTRHAPSCVVGTKYVKRGPVQRKPKDADDTYSRHSRSIYKTKTERFFVLLPQGKNNSFKSQTKECFLWVSPFLRWRQETRTGTQKVGLTDTCVLTIKDEKRNVSLSCSCMLEVQEQIMPLTFRKWSRPINQQRRIDHLAAQIVSEWRCSCQGTRPEALTHFTLGYLTALWVGGSGWTGKLIKYLSVKNHGMSKRSQVSKVKVVNAGGLEGQCAKIFAAKTCWTLLLQLILHRRHKHSRAGRKQKCQWITHGGWGGVSSDFLGRAAESRAAFWGLLCRYGRCCRHHRQNLRPNLQAKVLSKKATRDMIMWSRRW